MLSGMQMTTIAGPIQHKETIVEYLHTNEDGSTTKYTDDMIKNAIIDCNYHKKQSNTYFVKYSGNRDKVYEFFKDRYDSSDDTITATVDDVNELLESIGSEKLKVLFTITGTINFTITDLEAESEDEAREIVEGNLSVDLDFGNGSLDDWDVDINDTTQQ